MGISPDNYSGQDKINIVQFYIKAMDAARVIMKTNGIDEQQKFTDNYNKLSNQLNDLQNPPADNNGYKN